VGADNPRIEELRRRVSTDPASIAFAQLAEEYRRAGEFEQAIRVCRNGLSRYPDYHSARVTLARALLSLERLDEAKTEFQLVLKGAPDNLAAARGLDEIRQMRGESPLAATPPSLLVDKPRAAEVLFDLDTLLEQLDERARRLAENPPPPQPEPEAPAESRDERALSELESWLGAILADRKRLSGT
jgi:tetratricopeptide (TPR) repeat protein